MSIGDWGNYLLTKYAIYDDYLTKLALKNQKVKFDSAPTVEELNQMPVRARSYMYARGYEDGLRDARKVFDWYKNAVDEAIRGLGGEV